MKERKALLITLRVLVCLCLLGMIVSVVIYGYTAYSEQKVIEELYTRIAQQEEKINSSNVTVRINDKEFSKLLTDLVTYIPVIDESAGSVRWDAIINESALREWLTSMRIPAKNAYVTLGEDGWAIVSEEDSYNLMVNEAYKSVFASISAPTLYYDLTEFVRKADIVTEDLKEDFEQVEWLNNFSVYYGNVEVLSGKDLNKYVVDMELEIDNVDLSTVKSLLASTYNTAGYTLKFTTTAGEEIDVKYVTYGKSVNWEKEEKEIREAITAHKSLSKNSPSTSGFDNWKDEYIELSIQDQRVWHYVGGELCCESDCVTGLKGSRDTPTGVYYVSERINGKWLTGPTWRNWVDKWMRLTNSGIGLHDASWRSKFGGSIYKSNGSHGCINLPSKYAYTLFDEIERGTAVIIY